MFNREFLSPLAWSRHSHRELQVRVQSSPGNLTARSSISGCIIYILYIILLYYRYAGPNRRPLTPCRYRPAKGQQEILKPKGRILPSELYSSRFSMPPLPGAVTTAPGWTQMSFPVRAGTEWDTSEGWPSSQCRPQPGKSLPHSASGMRRHGRCGMV